MRLLRSTNDSDWRAQLLSLLLTEACTFGTGFVFSNPIQRWYNIQRNVRTGDYRRHIKYVTRYNWLLTPSHPQPAHTHSQLIETR